jgi:hypothetical protein
MFPLHCVVKILIVKPLHPRSHRERRKLTPLSLFLFFCYVKAYCHPADWSGRLEILEYIFEFPSCGVLSRMLVQYPEGDRVKGRPTRQGLVIVELRTARGLLGASLIDTYLLRSFIPQVLFQPISPIN